MLLLEKIASLVGIGQAIGSAERWFRTPRLREMTLSMGAAVLLAAIWMTAAHAEEERAVSQASREILVQLGTGRKTLDELWEGQPQGDLELFREALSRRIADGTVAHEIVVYHGPQWTTVRVKTYYLRVPRP
jgi:hypothetical protein